LTHADAHPKIILNLHTESPNIPNNRRRATDRLGEFLTIQKYMKFPAALLCLGLAFGASLVLTIGVGAANLKQMAKMKAEIQHITDVHWQSSLLAQQVLGLSSRNNRITLQVFLLTDEKVIDLLLKERRQNSDQITALIRQIAGLVTTDEERQLLDAITQARQPYVESYQTALNLLLHESKLADARQMLLTVTLPRLHVYHEAWEKFVNYQSDQIAQSGAVVEACYNQVYQRSLRLFTIGALLAFGIAGLVLNQLRQNEIVMGGHSRALEQVNRVLKTYTKPADNEKLWVETLAPHRSEGRRH